MDSGLVNEELATKLVKALDGKGVHEIVHISAEFISKHQVPKDVAIDICNDHAEQFDNSIQATVHIEDVSLHGGIDMVVITHRNADEDYIDLNLDFMKGAIRKDIIDRDVE